MKLAERVLKTVSEARLYTPEVKVKDGKVKVVKTPKPLLLEKTELLKTDGKTGRLTIYTPEERRNRSKAMRDFHKNPVKSIKKDDSSKLSKLLEK